jgi:lipoprotein-anchoring transpeptidase ErfK/SrfK
MWIRTLSVVVVLGVVPAMGATAPAQPLSPDAVNGAELQPAAPAAQGKGKRAKDSTKSSTKRADPAMLKAQVLLDRSGFSPGAIDAFDGENVQKALAAFQQQNGLQPSGKLDPDTWSKLTATSQDPVLIDYEITQADVKGPFEKTIPPRLELMAKLKRLSYRSPREMLAEKFHMDESLLRQLNPKAAFDKAGTKIVVANVPQAAPKGKVARLEVRKGERVLNAFDGEGKLVAFYPISIGSSEKPAPSGSFKVRAVAQNPPYQYDPKFAFKEVKAQKKFTVPPGPNNPVGAAWIDLTVETYGIHGTPEPSKIGKTESHGCVRLTNWDVLRLAKMVDKTTAVDFVE